MKKVYVVLSNGKIFEGEAFGADKEVIGELVFTTSMTGYVEALTDPSFFGQIVVGTFPMAGNYGVMEADMESGGSAVRGFVVREWCRQPSNFRMEGSIDAFMKKYGIAGVSNIDTRELTRIIRECGVMGAVICEKVTDDVIGRAAAFRITGAVAAVSTKEKKVFAPEGEVQYDVALIDYGTKRNIARELQKRACRVTLLPHDTPAEAILQGGYDGVMLSNGPGDPSENAESIAQLQKLIGQKPIFGICLGHQLLALAMGANTFKMKYGHRGANQPALDPATGKAYITSQNHGYAVDSDTLPEGARVSFVNANDLTCEGVDYPGQSAFSVQFHPEGCAGPRDSAALFDRFVAMMGGEADAEG